MKQTLNRLGVYRRFGNEWSQDEIDILHRDYRIYGPTYLAKTSLKRHSKSSVSSKARELGLTRTWVLTEKID